MLENIKTNKMFLISTAFFLSIILFGIIGTQLAGDPWTRHRDDEDNNIPRQKPDSQFLLGTNGLGQDILARLAIATQTSIMLGVTCGIIITIIAVVIGAVGGYFGGIFDEFAQLITNIFLVFPVLPFLLTLAAFIEERSLELVGLVVILFSWPWAARSIRSQVLSLKERDFVNLARISNSNGLKIAIAEILPYMLAYIVLIFAISCGGAIAAEAGISMIGFGPDQTSHVTLGTMLYWAFTNESVQAGYWWIYLPPGIILTIFFVNLYVMQASVDEILNPRLRKS